MRPPLPSAPPERNELPPAALGPPNSAGGGMGKAGRQEAGMGDRPPAPPPLCSQPPPSAKPAAPVRERDELSRRKTPGRTQRKAPGRWVGKRGPPPPHLGPCRPPASLRNSVAPPHPADPGSPGVLQLGSGGKSLASSPRWTLRSSLSPAGFCPPITPPSSSSPRRASGPRRHQRSSQWIQRWPSPASSV